MERELEELIQDRQARLRMVQAEGRIGIAEDQPVSLAALFALSVNRLSEDDRLRFAMLKPLGGDPSLWEEAAAAATWDTSLEDAQQTISRLIQRGLVERRGEFYWMHALLADYAAELYAEYTR
jgi:hypothetical protein